MTSGQTTADIQKYLDQLADLSDDMPAESFVRDLLARSVDRLNLLCGTLLFRNYPRLARPPLNLQSEELLSAVVERLLKAMREIRPRTVRQFFALANQHMRWELNDLARRLDEQAPAPRLEYEVAAAMESSSSPISPIASRLLEAIETLPDEEREVFELIRLQGMTQVEAADMLDVSPRTVLRRLNRGILLLAERLGDLSPELASDS